MDENIQHSQSSYRIENYVFQKKFNQIQMGGLIKWLFSEAKFSTKKKFKHLFDNNNRKFQEKKTEILFFHCQESMIYHIVDRRKY